jgi:hypothetical protein
VESERKRKSEVKIQELTRLKNEPWRAVDAQNEKAWRLKWNLGL